MCHYHLLSVDNKAAGGVRYLRVKPSFVERKHAAWKSPKGFARDLTDTGTKVDNGKQARVRF